MKRDAIIILIGFVLIVLAGFSFFQNSSLTGNAISTITFPADCSEANIKTLWD